MVIVDKKFTPGKDLRLLRGGPGHSREKVHFREGFTPPTPPSRGGYTPVPGGVVDELRLLHPHLRPISADFKNANIDMTARNGRSFFENEHFRIISRILAV